MAKSDVLVRMKADTSGYDANIAKARRQLDQFKQDNLTLGGVLNQSTKSIVIAATQYASFAAIIGTVASGMKTVISEGTAMAREMEGVKMAFDRLNQPGLLENLREATHGTVNDLELMKNAVKFENFGLSLEQMGTFLAFAQQQAKDTGQSVEYLVDSIVTGLGRKSLPILDNLGLSATEIRERMKDTGDMTTAVADIIKERMENAGGYIETAADRAAQAQVRLDNAMTDLGKTFQSLTGEASGLWTELEIGAINLLNTAIKPLIAAFNSLASYVNVPSAEDLLTRGMTDVTDTVDDNGRLINKNAITSIPGITVTGKLPKKTGSGRGGSVLDPQSLAGMEQKVSQLTKAWREATGVVRDGYLKKLVEAEAVLNRMKEEQYWAKELASGKYSGNGDFAKGMSGARSLRFNTTLDDMVSEGKDKAKSGSMLLSDKAMAVVTKQIKESTKSQEEEKKYLSEGLSQLSGGLGGLQSGFSQLGIDLGDGFGSVVSGLQGISTILMAIQTIVGAIEAISAVDSIIPFARGGIVRAASGTIVGNSYSGDNLRAISAGGQVYGLNAGEVVLNRAQAGNLASQLTGTGLNNLKLETYVDGRALRIVLNNESQGRMKGKYVTSRNYKG